jgi:hypothetical protein
VPTLSIGWRPSSIDTTVPTFPSSGTPEAFFAEHVARRRPALITSALAAKLGARLTDAELLKTCGKQQQVRVERQG